MPMYNTRRVYSRYNDIYNSDHLCVCKIVSSFTASHYMGGKSQMFIARSHSKDDDHERPFSVIPLPLQWFQYPCQHIKWFVLSPHRSVGVYVLLFCVRILPLSLLLLSFSPPKILDAGSNHSVTSILAEVFHLPAIWLQLLFGHNMAHLYPLILIHSLHPLFQLWQHNFCSRMRIPSVIYFSWRISLRIRIPFKFRLNSPVLETFILLAYNMRRSPIVIITITGFSSQPPFISSFLHLYGEEKKQNRKNISAQIWSTVPHPFNVLMVNFYMLIHSLFIHVSSFLWLFLFFLLLSFSGSWNTHSASHCRPDQPTSYPVIANDPLLLFQSIAAEQ